MTRNQKIKSYVTMPTRPIDIILPYKEHMSAGNQGAIATIVQDLVHHSGMADQFRVFGRPASGMIAQPIDYHGVKVRFPFLHGGHNAGFAKAYLKQIRQDGLPRAIEVHGRCRNARIIASAYPEIPTFLYLHNDPTQMAGAKTIAERRWLATHLAGIFCVSEFIRQKFLSGLSDSEIDSQNIITLHNGVERWLGKPAHKQNTIVIAGRMVPEKGIYPACKAVKPVLEAHRDWHLHIIGGKHFADAPLSAYERKIAALLEHMGEQVTIHGFMGKSALRSFQQHAAIIIVPSLWDEPAGLTNIEALAAGAALISTGTGGSSEYIKDRAIIVPVDSHDDYDSHDFPEFTAALSQACHNLIEDSHKRQALQNAAWKNYIHDAHTMAENAVNIREKLIKSFTSTLL